MLFVFPQISKAALLKNYFAQWLRLNWKSDTPHSSNKRVDTHVKLKLSAGVSKYAHFQKLFTSSDTPWNPSSHSGPST